MKSPPDSTIDHAELRPEIRSLLERGAWRRIWIVTGGQSGTDRAAMDLAFSLGLPFRGWCPSERWSESGRIDPVYPLQETGSPDPAVRTELNVIDSDATLVLKIGEARDGTPLTEQCAEKHGRPLLRFEIGASPTRAEIGRFREWIDRHSIRILNVAGPRESHMPGVVYARSMEWLRALFMQSREN